MNTNSVHISKKQLSTKGIFSLTPFTLLDYPHKTACIVWFAGCNMRCLYCYNPEIVLGKGKMDFDSILSFLKTRKRLLDGVVLSGGECTLSKNIISFIKEIKTMGFAVKIDTNGSNPKVLNSLIHDQLIDYVALDYKSLPHTFKKITQSGLFSPFEESLKLLIQSNIPFEIRTTFHSSLITETDFVQMIEYLETQNFEGNYYVQHFMNNVPTLSKLNDSHKEIRLKNYSTSKIKVVFRE
ncbi:anaerobic ribonucleoside-triphosphate reductase activating protein [Flavobacterium quisquiliarum]|uniref:Anaerobic ribonucleoside-triphosphate reductase activating protein n=1 Tax=Flavobacterium quisquiliarum TaxID=1834436 RepID=A0ABV8W7V4_9FLAO|nr:anaerobic ribonucleoside-triphosphate reductase activating protein [Flavobacterium quisquiliarum]MBW1654303.1 anaerobic ribonucleoside-triphosphate reductase activating protein [Flavobacterium quisquiliarum]NWL03346.1 anaerobic ribonucleoside-triphosphate reductase activating protein [Flavobacterium collinsii]